MYTQRRQPSWATLIIELIVSIMSGVGGIWLAVYLSGLMIPEGGGKRWFLAVCLVFLFGKMADDTAAFERRNR